MGKQQSRLNTPTHTEIPLTTQSTYTVGTHCRPSLPSRCLHREKNWVIREHSKKVTING